MFEILKFGDPKLSKVNLSRKYELEGVAFHMQDEKPIGFTLYSQSKGRLDLTIDAIEHSLDLYKFFKSSIFNQPLSPMKKDPLLPKLNVELRFENLDKEKTLVRIEKTMSVEWRKAFDIIFTAH